jgi:hypothetical protein
MENFILNIKWWHIVTLIFVIILFYSFIRLIRTMFEIVFVFNNLEKALIHFIKENKNETFIWFKYKGDEAIGKVFNRSDDLENPDFYVIAIYLKTNATQTVQLKDIKEYFPITFDSPLNTLKNNYKKQEENE